MSDKLTTSIHAISSFLPHAQLEVITEACLGEEGEFFIKRIIELAQQIDSMPVTYEQDGKGDLATVHLHYFVGSCDWYITEKDVDGGVRQAYGYAILNGDDENAECGYIAIDEITRCGAELDLYFTPCSLGAIKAERAVRK